jgi:hypothetical protein
MPTSRAPTVSRTLTLVLTALAALATAVSLGALADDPARAASPGDQVVVTTGTIRAPSGRLVTAGTVHALALVWVPGRGQVGHPLGKDEIGADGTFEVTVPPDRLARWRDDDDGLQVELVVDTPQGGMIWDLPVTDVTPPPGADPSRRLLRDDPDLAGLDLTLGRGETNTEDAIALGPRTRSMGRSEVSPVLLRQPAYITNCLSRGGTFEWSVPPRIKTRIRWLPIQLMITRGRSVARVTYQSDLSSAFGVVVTASGDGVAAGLSRTAVRTHEYAAGALQRRSRTRAAKVDIRYARLRGYCFIGSNDSASYWTNAYKWKPYRWRGGVKKLPTRLGWGCQKTYTTSGQFARVRSGRSTKFQRVGSIGAGPLSVRVESETTRGRRVALRLTAKSGWSQFPYCGFRTDPSESYLIREKT